MSLELLLLAIIGVIPLSLFAVPVPLDGYDILISPLIAI